MGEPIFAQQPMHAPAGRTVVDTGQSAMSMTPQPMPAMPMHTHQQQMHGQMGGMGGPAYPAPPPPAAGKPSSNNMMPIIAGIAVFTVLGIVVAVFAFGSKSSGTEGEVLTLPSATTPTAVIVASDPPTSPSNGTTAEPASSSGATGTIGTVAGGSTAGAGTTSPTSTSTTTKTTTSVDPKADAACDAAINLARGANTSLAISQYRSCAGPKRSSALGAINTSATREVRSKGCAAKSVAQQAASIGATGGKDALPASCK
jgi:hypothetical protein